MRKQEQEALHRLESALLEPEEPQDLLIDDDEELESIWQERIANEYDAYNTDVTDVDLDEYSEDVLRGSRNNPFLPVVIILCLLLLAASLLILMRFLGVI